MLEKIHGHTIDTNFLTKGGYVLDLGCRDFVFSKIMLSYGMKVIALDPYKNITLDDDLKNNPNFIFKNIACVGIKDTETKKYHEYDDWGANSLFNIIPKNPNYNGNETYDVNLTTIKEIMQEFNIEIFDVIKIDVEGCEYEILKNIPKNCSKQLSVEFHDWLGLNPYEDVEQYYNEVENEQLKDYEVVIKEKVSMNNGTTYSDVLYKLK